jgi:hypothetical protein
MHISDIRALQKVPRARNDLACRRHRAGAVDDAVIGSITAHDIIGAVQHRRNGLRLRIALTGVGMQKHRPRFRIGLQRGKGPVGEDQHPFAFPDLTKAVAAGHAAGRNGFLRRIAIGVGGSRPVGFGFLSRHCSENEIGHDGDLLGWDRRCFFAAMVPKRITIHPILDRRCNQPIA